MMEHVDWPIDFWVSMATQCSDKLAWLSNESPEARLRRQKKPSACKMGRNWIQRSAGSGGNDSGILPQWFNFGFQESHSLEKWVQASETAWNVCGFLSQPLLKPKGSQKCSIPEVVEGAVLIHLAWTRNKWVRGVLQVPGMLLHVFAKGNELLKKVT